MKKVILSAITIFVVAIGAKENCQGPETYPNPPYSCQQTGYVCNLGFDVNGEDNVMYFHLGTDAACTNLFKSDSLQTFLTESDTTKSSSTKFFLVENQENVGPLSLTLAGSLAMLAINNNTPIEIIYKKVKRSEYGGIKLLSIKLVHSN
ncbi:hypothetical protein [Fibrobacter sp.]|uniref:hypothetical protein n=1 Tax=Fibrobacter sp. TaxID=35828 RepID=UPI00386F5DEF